MTTEESAAPVFMAVSISLDAFRDLLDSIALNLAAQQSQTEQMCARKRFIVSSDHGCEDYARAALKPGEQLSYDDQESGWVAISARPRYELESWANTRRNRVIAALTYLRAVGAQLPPVRDDRPRVVSTLEVRALLSSLASFGVNAFAETAAE